VARRSGLGRGLSALIPQEVGPSRTSSLSEVPIADIKPSRFQPRVHFDEESMAALAASIREIGVLQPVLLRPSEEGGYEIIAGERRWRAARRAGLQSVPALIQTATDVVSLEQALVENLHREDLNALEEAAAYQQLIEDFNLTHEELARRVGRSRAAVSNALRLFHLPPGVQRLVSDGRLSAGQARAILGTPDREAQQALALEAVEQGLSVRVLEERVRRLAEIAAAEQGPVGDGHAAPADTGGAAPSSGSGSGADQAAPVRRLRAPGVIELEELLSEHLSTRVRVEMTSRKGRVVIEFATLEDLERIYRVMIGEPAHR
jgi:ParB family chromosome partitioning protein